MVRLGSPLLFMRTVVVVGAGVAGVAAALSARQRGAHVTLLEEGRVMGLNRSLFPRILERDPDGTEGAASAHELGVAKLGDLEDLGIDVSLGEGVRGLDAPSHVLYTGRGRRTYDSVVLCSGSRPRDPVVRGSSKPGVFALKGEEDYRALARSAGSRGPVVIAGSAPLSLVVADALTRRVTRGIGVYVGAGGLNRFCPPIRSLLKAAASRNGVELVEAEVDAIVGTAGVEAVVSGLRVFPAATVALITRNCPVLPPGLACATGVDGGAIVDGSMRTSLKDVLAAGDCAELRAGSTSLPMRLQSTSLVTGRTAGVVASGGVARARLSFSIPLRVFGTELLISGLDRQSALASGLQVFEKEFDPAGSYPGARHGEAHASVLFERVTNRILGVQAIGPGLASSCDAVSLAISSGLTLEQLEYSEAPFLPWLKERVFPIRLTAGVDRVGSQERVFEAPGPHLRYRR